MIYDFVLINGNDRGSIRPVRTYETSIPLTKILLNNINTVLAQAFNDTGRVTGENANAYVELSKSWVKKSRKGNERLDMLLTSDFMIDRIGVLDTRDVRAIAKILLNDLASTEDWEFVFEGSSDDFSHKDFDRFTLIDTTVDNSNLQIPIGTEVYVRGWDDNILVYQGRPIKEQINEGMNPFVMNHGVWAVEDEVIAVSDVKVKDYANRMETFPLPLGGPAKYFSREKNKGVTHKEAMAVTQTQSKLRLAIMLAFDDKSSA